MKALAIINPISGVSPKTRIPALLAEEFQHSPMNLFISFTKKAGHARELAQRAVQEDYDMVIAIGGDGTVNEIASALIGSKTILSILPLGSGNGLSRALGIPNQIKMAAELITSDKGRVRLIDSCSINNIPFFCTCGMGYDAAVTQAFSNKRHRGKVTYAASMIEEFLKYNSDMYHIYIDGKESIETSAFLITAANASQYGNNAYIAPKASLSDGVMDLVIIQPFDKIMGPTVALRLFSKKILEANNVLYRRAKSIEIERQNEGPVHIDGEPIHFGRKLTIQIKPSSLYVRVPKEFEEN